MVTITLLEDSNGVHKGFIADGHTGYAEKGVDIVCASVSILTLNTINAIEVYTRDVIDVERNDKEGFLAMHFLSEPSSDARLLMDAMILGLSGIEDQYGKYVKILLEEV